VKLFLIVLGLGIVTFWLLAVAMFWYGVHRQKKLNKK